MITLKMYNNTAYLLLTVVNCWSHDDHNNFKYFKGSLA